MFDAAGTLIEDVNKQEELCNRFKDIGACVRKVIVIQF